MSLPPAVRRAIYAAKREGGVCVSSGCEQIAMRSRSRCFTCLLKRAAKRRAEYQAMKQAEASA